MKYYDFLFQTYCTDHQVSDSGSTGTAYLSGVKNNERTIGVDVNVKKANCDSFKEEYKVNSISKWFLDAGKRAGFVTTTRVTHATPANMYAHTCDRDWEVDSAVPEGCDNVKDIARQLVEDSPGNQLHVIMGGGRQVYTLTFNLINFNFYLFF